jgi:hypothetical protein
MLALESYRDRARGSLHIYSQEHVPKSQEHVPKKLLDFFDQDMLQLFDFERVLIDQMIPLIETHSRAASKDGCRVMRGMDLSLSGSQVRSARCPSRNSRLQRIED